MEMKIKEGNQMITVGKRRRDGTSDYVNQSCGTASISVSGFYLFTEKWRYEKDSGTCWIEKLLITNGKIIKALLSISEPV